MKRLTRLYYLLVTIVLPTIGIIFAAGAQSSRSFLENRCSRFCHDKGCLHDPILPRVLSGDDGLFGNAIHFLFETGKIFENHMGFPVGTGYGAANLLIFCLFPPLLHIFMFLVTKRLLK
jgi:hypothetical protein